MNEVLQQYAFAVLAGWLALMVVALGFTLQFSVTRYYDMTQALAITIGGYAGLLLSRATSSVLLSACAAAAAGAVTALTCRSILHGRLTASESSPLMHFLVSIGAVTIGQNAIAIVFGDDAQRIVLPRGAGLRSSHILAVISVVFITVAIVVLATTRAGRGAKFVAIDVEVAATTGINVRRVAAVLCATGGALMGSAGAGLAIDTSMTPTSAVPVFLDGVVASLLRPQRHFWSLLLTTGLLVACKQLVVFAIGGQWQDALTYSFFVLAVVARGPLRLVRWS